MSRILADIEKGAVTLIHDLPDAPTDPAAIPGHLVPAVTTFAESLGLEAEKLTGGEAGWLFDLLGRAVEAVASAQDGAGHASAGAGEVPPAGGDGAPAEGAHVAETEVSAENPTGTLPANGEATTGEPEASPEVGVPAGGHAPADTSGIDAAVAKARSDWGGGEAPASA